MAYNRYNLPTVTAYDALRRQYPALVALAARGARIGDRLAAWDQAGVDRAAAVALVVWRSLDRFLADLGPTLAVDALVGVGELRRAWAGLWLRASTTIAPAAAAATLTATGEGEARLDAARANLRAGTLLPGPAWLDGARALLATLGEA